MWYNGGLLTGRTYHKKYGEVWSCKVTRKKRGLAPSTRTDSQVLTSSLSQ